MRHGIFEIGILDFHMSPILVPITNRENQQTIRGTPLKKKYQKAASTTTNMVTPFIQLYPTLLHAPGGMMPSSLLTWQRERVVSWLVVASRCWLLRRGKFFVGGAVDRVRQKSQCKIISGFRRIYVGHKIW